MSKKLRSTSKESQPKVTIVVLNYNGEEDTIRCVESLGVLEYSNYELVVIDNCSEEASFERLRKNIGDVKLIRTGENKGFAGGNNVGVDYALTNGSKYAVILNNDTTVRPRWLSELVEVAESDPKIGLVGSKALYMGREDIIQSTGIGYSSSGAFYYDRGEGEKDTGQYDKQEVLVGVSGVSMLINLGMSEDLVHFNESFFMYYEDTELCLRVGKAGYKIVYAPKSVLEHKFSATADRYGGLKVYYGVRNRLRVLKKYQSFGTFLFAYLKSWGRGVLNLFSFDLSLIQNHFRALITI